jgi:hypothetical protein
MKSSRSAMSPSFRSDVASGGPGARRPRSVRHTSCIALVDDRFTAWLVDRDCEPGSEPPVSRRYLLRILGRLAGSSGLDLSLRRLYWYTDRPDGQLVDEQIVRTADEGEETWKLLEGDLRRLTEGQACETVLIACDDERLLPAIDEAQLRGISIVMLADEGVLDYSLLREEDPEWAMLLAQADRRLAVRADELAELRPHPNGIDTAPHRQPDNPDDQATIEEVVRDWWSSQSEESREELRVALAQSSGIPQEVDRELLLQSRVRFVRPLSFIEKKQMRSCLRGIAGGGIGGGAPESSVAGYA